jgi:hypothetical protein
LSGSSSEDPGGGEAEEKHDRRDARLILDLLLMPDRFPEIVDAVDGAAGFADFAERSSPVGQDASAIAAHHAVDRTQ